jgi:beta-N-acetylhexosaminidase
MRRSFLYLGVVLCLASCGPSAAAIRPSATPRATSGATPAIATPSATANAEQEATLGPGGMTLRQEIGAVMMVGFKGALTPAILADWRQHQFGGLIVVPINENAPDPTAIRQLIQSVRSVMAHPVLAATNQEGGSVCFLETRVPCLAGARQVGSRGPAAVQSEMTTMSQGLKGLGFDINFAPVADVWDGAHPFMSERSYGQNPQAVAQDVTAAIAGIHAAGIYAAAKQFPGQGAARDVIPFRAAVAAHVDFVMVGHLSVPALDGQAPASMSSAALQMLRTELGYQGIIISDDLQMGALSPEFPPPTAAVRFLINGGDMVMVSHDIAVADATYDAIHTAVLSGVYPRTQLDASAQRLLSLGLRYMP